MNHPLESLSSICKLEIPDEILKVPSFSCNQINFICLFLNEAVIFVFKNFLKSVFSNILKSEIERGRELPLSKVKTHSNK